MNPATDVQLHQDVMGELEAGPRLDTSWVAVAVRNGVVTLSGSVPSGAAKSAMLEAIRQVHGVLGVIGDLTLRPLPQPHPGSDVAGRNMADRNTADRNMAEAARWALEWAVITAHHGIRVKVENGWLTLEGEVGRREQRQDAQDAVSRLRGVQGVTNRLTLTPRPASQGSDASPEAASWHSAFQDAAEVSSG